MVAVTAMKSHSPFRDIRYSPYSAPISPTTAGRGSCPQDAGPDGMAAAERVSAATAAAVRDSRFVVLCIFMSVSSLPIL